MSRLASVESRVKDLEDGLLALIKSLKKILAKENKVNKKVEGKTPKSVPEEGVEDE